MTRKSLPQVGALSQLAAQLYVPGSGKDSVSDAVKLAGEIWLECQAYIDAENEGESRPSGDYHPYDQPIKIENHFMPRVDVEFLEKKKVTRDELLKAVVGLSKVADSQKMFRDFLCVVQVGRSKERFESMEFHLVGDSDPYGAMTDEDFDQTFNDMRDFLDRDDRSEPEPKPEPKPRPDVEAILTSLRLYGTESHHAILRNFREWRIWESIPLTKDHEYSEIFKKALKKGLEHEIALKNGTSPE